MAANTGPEPHTPDAYVLYPLIGWKLGKELCYVLEGGGNCAGQAVEWGKDFGLYRSPTEIDALAQSVPNTDGVCFVNAFGGGMATPSRDATTQASVVGMCSSTRPAHVARAILNSVAFSFTDMVEILQQTLDPPAVIYADGGVSRSDLTVQTASTLSGIPIQRSKDSESTATGAAFFAGLYSGFWKSRDDLRRLKKWKDVVKPVEDEQRVEELQDEKRKWDLCVERCSNWE